MNATLWQILSGTALLLGIIIGWFVRHGILNRHVKKLEKKLEDASALKLNRDHESFSVRQKIMEKDITIQSLQKKLKELNSQLDEMATLRQKEKELSEKIKKIEEEQFKLMDQIEYESNQKQSYMRKIEALSQENQKLLIKIKSLSSELKHFQQQQSSIRSKASVSSKIIGTGFLNKPGGKNPASDKPTSTFKSRVQKATDKFAARNKESKTKHKSSKKASSPKTAKPKKSTTASSIRLLEAIAEEARNPKQKRSIEKG